MVRYALVFMLLLVCSPVIAQLDVKFKVISQEEFSAPPRVVGNKVLYDPKTKIGETVLGALFVTGPADTIEIIAERMSIVDGEIVIQDAEVSVIGERQYSLTGSGTYSVQVIGYGPGSAISRFPRFKVKLDLPKPEPIPDPVDALSHLSKEVRDVMVAYAQGMGKDFETLSAEIKAGKYKTVAESSSANNALDVVTRSTFKQSMGRIMAPKLGNSALPTNAPVVFQEIANGFKGVK